MILVSARAPLVPYVKELVPLGIDQRELLEQWSRAHGTPQQVAQRCRIILLNDQGWSDGRIARELELNCHTCRLWRRRFLLEGAESLWEVGEGRGRKPRAALSQKIVETTLHTKPEGQTHWSTRTLAKQQGVHASTVCRMWQEHELQPHRQETFKLSRDPEFVAKLLDVVGVYLTPPQNALVLCVDEKSQIQALDRTQPGLPLKPGRCGTWTHDYVRHGTTTLFAALEVAHGKVVGQCFSRHRHRRVEQRRARLRPMTSDVSALSSIVAKGHQAIPTFPLPPLKFRTVVFPQ